MTHGVDEVQLPGVSLEGLEGHGVGISVEGQGGLDGQVHDHETLGTELVRQDLDRVADEQTGPGERVEDGENPNEEKHGVVGAGGALLFVEGGGERPEDEGAEHATGGGEEHGAAAELVDEHGHAERDDERHAGLAGRETELLGRVGDAGAVVELGGIVGNDGVTGPLGEDTERDEDHEAVTVALGLEEVGVAGGLGSLELEGERLLDLAVLELDGGVVGVAVGVVLGEHGKGLLVPVLGDQVTGRLGHPEDEGELDDGGDGLEQGGHTPRPVALDEVGAEGNPGDEQGTDVPQAVVDGGQASTVLGMGDLGEKHGGRDLGQGVAETEEGTAAHEGAEAGASGLDDGTDDHDNAADGDGELTAEVVGEQGAASRPKVSFQSRPQSKKAGLDMTTYTRGMETKLPIW